jgi:hypothetical protein
MTNTLQNQNYSGFAVDSCGVLISRPPQSSTLPSLRRNPISSGFPLPPHSASGYGTPQHRCGDEILPVRVVYGRGACQSVTILDGLFDEAELDVVLAQ